MKTGRTFTQHSFNRNLIQSRRFTWATSSSCQCASQDYVQKSTLYVANRQFRCWMPGLEISARKSHWPYWLWHQFSHNLNGLGNWHVRHCHWTEAFMCDGWELGPLKVVSITRQASSGVFPERVVEQFVWWWWDYQFELSPSYPRLINNTFGKLHPIDLSGR